MSNILLNLMWVSSVFSLILSALAFRDWMLKKGLWITEPESNAFFRFFHSMLYDAEERLKEHISEVGNDLSNEHRIMLIDRIESIKRLIKDQKK